MNPKIALAQFVVKIGSPAENLDNALKYLAEANRQGCHLILLPELWTSGYDLENLESYVRTNQDVLKDLQERVDQTGIMIGGSYITRQKSDLYNTFYLLVPGGGQPIGYNKIHLFRPLDEPQYFSAGDTISIADTSIGRLGLAICYDVRFPEMFRAFCRERVDIILVVAQWGSERTNHWRTLLRARAIENQVFVAAVNATGPVRQWKNAGYSAIFDPWGDVLAEANSSDEVLLTAEIDLDTIKTANQKIPSREDARIDLYPGWF